MTEYELPFTEEWQEAIIGNCIVNAKFFMKCYGKLKPGWFTKNLKLGTLYDQLCKSYELYGQFIKSVADFKNETFFLEQKRSEQEAYYQLIDRCAKLSVDLVGIDKLERNLTGFLRVSMFKESIEGASRIYRSDGYEDAFNWTTDQLKKIQNATLVDDNLIMSFDNPDTWIAEHEVRKGAAISTGNELLDSALGGGLFKKEACAFMAPANVGKTTAMITLARHAVWNRNKVLFLIHEGFPEEIRLRFIASFLGVSTNTIYRWRQDPQMRQWLMFAAGVIKNRLTFVPYIRTNAMYVEDVIEKIIKLNMEEKMRTGTGYDLIIDDYPKKLKSRTRTNTREGLYRVEVAEVYENFNHLAAELDAHTFVAIQTNRQGLKQNNDRVETDFLLGMEEMDESFGIAQNIPNIITLNRSPYDKKKNIMRMNVTRSRNSQTDIVVNTRTDYACCLAFGDKKMFEHDGMWHNELDNGFLPSYLQSDNSKPKTELVDQTLLSQIGLNPNVEGIGVAVPGAAKVENNENS